ncbi:hypothetical protein J6590_033793 [Homalodisca vitripennis]|nr:hypothetical protein J6590_033793 [Homalodisca vitripennis]
MEERQCHSPVSKGLVIKPIPCPPRYPSYKTTPIDECYINMQGPSCSSRLDTGGVTWYGRAMTSLSPGQGRGESTH